MFDFKKPIYIHGEFKHFLRDLAIMFIVATFAAIGFMIYVSTLP